jgi:UDP:flavonoid glycosyltransferase YjiC (YdhE family)
MKILFGTWPGYGHLLPMVPLIRAAQQGGHDVLVSTGADMAGLIGRLGVRHHRSGVTLAESYARLPDRATVSELPAEQQAGFAGRHLFGAGAVDRARDVLELLPTWRPDLVVHDTLELGTPTAAAVHGIPHITHGYGPTVPHTRELLAAIGSALAAAGLPIRSQPSSALRTWRSARSACAEPSRTPGRTSTRSDRRPARWTRTPPRRSTSPDCRGRTPSTPPSAR